MAAGITFKLGGVLDPSYRGALAASVTEAKAATMQIEALQTKARLSLYNPSNQMFAGTSRWEVLQNLNDLEQRKTAVLINANAQRNAIDEKYNAYKIKQAAAFAAVDQTFFAQTMQHSPAQIAAINAEKKAITALRVEQLATLAAVAKGGTASAFGHGGGAGGGISGIMRETLVIFREIGRGNMTRVPGSLLLLLQYTGMLNLMMKSEKTEALLAAAAQEKLAVSTARSAMAAEAKLRAAKIKAGVDVRSPELQTAEAEAAMATSAAQEKRAASTALAAGWDTKSTEAAAANIVALEAERDAAIKDGIAQTLKAKETAAAAAVVKASAAQSLVAIGLIVLPVLLLVAAIVSWYIAIKSLVDWMNKKNATLKESMEIDDKYRTTVAEQIDAEEKVAEAIKKTTDALRKMNEAKNQSVELTRDAIDAAKEEADANEKLYDAKTKGKLLDISIAEKKGEITHEQGIHQRETIERQAVADKAAAKQSGLDNAAKITSDAADKAKKDAATARERARITGDAAANSPLVSRLSEAEKIKKVAAEEADKARKAQEDALTSGVFGGRNQKDIDAERHNEERQEAAEKSAEALIKRLRDKMSPGEISASEAMTQADEATAASKTLDEQAKKAGTAAATNAKNSPAEVAAEQSNISKQEELDLAKEKKPEERGGGRSATERERVGVGAPQVANLQKQTLDVTKMQLIEARKLNTQMDLLIKSGRGNNDLNNF